MYAYVCYKFTKFYSWGIKRFWECKIFPKEKGGNKVPMKMRINLYVITYYNPYFYGSREYYNVKQTSFFYIPWNKIPIFMFQGMLFIGINLVNLKQTHPSLTMHVIFLLVECKDDVFD